MKQCPACKRWTLDFDSYFSRYRCFNPDCGWMQMSSADREITLLRSRTKPKRLTPIRIGDLGLMLTPSYDSENDIFAVDFGPTEPSADLPAPDGRLVWRIGRHTDSVTGFFILGAKKWGLAGITIDIAARKEGIEEGLRALPPASLWGRVTKTLIDKVVVTAYSRVKNGRSADESVARGVDQAISEFEDLGVANSSGAMGKVLPSSLGYRTAD